MFRGAGFLTEPACYPDFNLYTARYRLRAFDQSFISYVPSELNYFCIFNTLRPGHCSLHWLGVVGYLFRTIKGYSPASPLLPVSISTIRTETLRPSSEVPRWNLTTFSCIEEPRADQSFIAASEGRVTK